jgi:uncharacterized membrane protein YgcG
VSSSTRLLLSLVTVTIVALTVVGVALVARAAAGDDGFVIDRFHRLVEVGGDGELEVTETIEVTFLEPRRGIFRDLESAGPVGPVSYELRDVEDADGSPWRAAEERTDDGDPRIRIGDAAVVLDPGPQTYVLRYRIDGLLFRPASRPDQVQVRVDVPGDGWPVEVAVTHLEVVLPTAPSDVRCVAGATGTTGACGEREVAGTQVSQRIDRLGPGETGTVAVELPADAFAAGEDLPVSDVRDLEDREVLASLGVPLVPATLLLLVLLAAPAALLEAVRSRTVYRDVVTDPHLHDRVTPTAELEPPDGLAPAELAALAQRSIDGEVLLATLVDLELRGVIHTTTRDDGGTITIQQGEDPSAARPWEATALDALCPRGAPITFDGEYDADTTERANGASAAVAGHAGGVLDEGSRYIHSRGGLLRGSGYVVLVLAVLLVGAVVGLAGIALLAVPVAAVVAAWVGLGVAWFVLAWLWRKERLPLTSEGRDAVERTAAFRRFLSEVHGDRLAFAASRREVGTTHPAVAMLPYAMVLGLADSWLERFEPLLVEAARNGEAGAARDPDAWYLHRGTLAAAAVTYGSTTTAPSSSSGGGSFGGGGAGSGGGGGGGGSW